MPYCSDLTLTHLIYVYTVKVPALCQFRRCSNFSVEPTPGEPVILPKPEDSQLPGSNFTIFCRSEGDSAATRLVWYRGNQPVDDSYLIESGYVVNQLDITLPVADALKLECRLMYPPTGLTASDYVTIPITGTPKRCVDFFGYTTISLVVPKIDFLAGVSACCSSESFYMNCEHRSHNAALHLAFCVKI